MTNIPVEEQTLMTIAYMGLHLQLTNDETLDLILKLVIRAAAARHKMTLQHPHFQISNQDLFMAIYRMTVYDPRFPEKVEHTTHSVCVRNLLWKAVAITLVMAALNPQQIGEFVSKLATVTFLIEKVITNQFADLYALRDDEQLAAFERNYIAEYVRQVSEKNRTSYIAMVTPFLEMHKLGIDLFQLKRENSDYFFQHFMMNDVNEHVRVPPQEVVKQIEAISQQVKLGNLFRSCRSPDFLFDIIKRDGTQQSLTWLSDILKTEQTTLQVLPVSIMCELLVMSNASAYGYVIVTLQHNI